MKYKTLSVGRDRQVYRIFQNRQDGLDWVGLDQPGWIGLVQHLTANERETNELHICAFINILFVRRLAPQI